MSETCDAPSPGGGLQCVRAPHATGGHVWHHPTAGGDPKEAALAAMAPKGGYTAGDFS
jgi:hypothetical protein